MGQGGAAIAINLPKPIIEYLEIQLEDEICLIADKSKHGKFVGLWNETKQKQTKLPVKKKK